MSHIISSILSVFRYRRFRQGANIKKRLGQCQSTTSFVRDNAVYDTDNNIPPTNDIHPKLIGRYCIKASIDLVDNTNSYKIYNIVGYDADLNIQKKVHMICDSYRAGDETLMCTNDKLMFLGPRRECEGNVVVTDVASKQEFFF